MIFVDTSFLFPLFHTGDIDHERVREVLESYRGRRLRDLLVTTTHVVSETVTLIRTTPPRSHAAAVEAGDFLLSEAFARIHRPSPEEEVAAWAHFKRYADKEYSFVDCLSFVVMEKLGIREALAVDEDFTHRFVAIPGPLKR